MAKRNWDVIVVVPGRTNNDGTETEAAYFSGKREERKLVDLLQVEAPVLVNRKTGKKA